MKIGRNAPCPCGSGKKYKNCCLASEASANSVKQKLLATLIVLIMVAGAIAVIIAFRSSEPSSGPARVWSEEHQHWH
jgi:hypothetical protein